MAVFTLNCATFVRMASIIEGYEPTEIDRAELMSVAVLFRGGKVFAAASNSKIFAVEFIGTIDAPDDIVRIIPDAKLVEQCRTETAFNSVLTVETNDMLKFATAKTSLGYNHPTNAALWDCHPGDKIDYLLNMMRGFKTVKKSKNAMHWYADGLRGLFNAAPSGRVLFPEHFDASEAVILRDPVDPNWCGLFLPTIRDSDKPSMTMDAATLPDWIAE